LFSASATPSIAPATATATEEAARLWGNTQEQDGGEEACGMWQEQEGE